MSLSARRGTGGAGRPVHGTAILTPRVAAIALTTSKESMSQPLLLRRSGDWCFCAAWCSSFVPYNTFGEDVKMLKDSGLTLIMVLSIMVAVWSASVSVAEEVEGRTALTVLSKPIRRRQFILGKFLGISGAGRCCCSSCSGCCCW